MLSITLLFFSPLPTGEELGERLLFKLRITVQYLCCRLGGCLCFAIGRLFRVLGISGIYQIGTCASCIRCSSSLAV